MSDAIIAISSSLEVVAPTPVPTPSVRGLPTLTSSDDGSVTSSEGERNESEDGQGDTSCAWGVGKWPPKN